MNNTSILLGVNVDHIATLRQARGTPYPDPVHAAFIAEHAGADGITVHLREDRRHIQPRDVEILRQVINTRLNLEMAVTDEMIAFAKKIKPAYCCLVPEKRQELTTEGGLNVIENFAAVQKACHELTNEYIAVSLFIDPDKAQIDAAVKAAAPVIEIHTGAYAEAKNAEQQQYELVRIQTAAQYAADAGLIVNAGHGLHYYNVQAIAEIDVMHELNIGHSIVAYASLHGMYEAVARMKQLMQEARL